MATCACLAHQWHVTLNASKSWDECEVWIFEYQQVIHGNMNAIQDAEDFWLPLVVHELFSVVRLDISDLFNCTCSYYVLYSFYQALSVMLNICVSTCLAVVLSCPHRHKFPCSYCVISTPFSVTCHWCAKQAQAATASYASCWGNKKDLRFRKQ